MVSIVEPILIYVHHHPMVGWALGIKGHGLSLWKTLDMSLMGATTPTFHEMFGGKGRPARQAALKAIMDAKMLEGTLVRDHMICMIRLFKEMEILGVEIDGET
ncbi:hypothetical protein CK203_048362 [Vitis vinifera]|uniref:Uncharacterized protein n=1 Tax=Vitis vinifera TaxID=29760 RepID=A0A438HRF0_VITVI|nr:hypothetical protein CK203_048362 [Vitis vinifera]